jgi:hypothetical protein
LTATYTEEAIADLVDALASLNERSPTAASKLDADVPLHRASGERLLRRPSLTASLTR